jgi:gas vesicle protein
MGLTMLGMALGATLGYALGLVYTPHGGSENRKRLSRWAQARLGGLQRKRGDRNRR